MKMFYREGILIRFYALSVSNNFDRNIANNIKTLFSQSRKDFYFDADSITSSQFNIIKNITKQNRNGLSNIRIDLSYDRFLDIFSLDLAEELIGEKLIVIPGIKLSELLPNQLTIQELMNLS